jgi:GalNAc-alpha-(1->4)-GalNAc-alpha-(1->3)-diNAcBac-PP-undecaprenol alpha-1,4-N-acetyl-D-galactosaminyltransferase
MRSVVLGTISLNHMAGGLEKNIVLLANHLAQRGDKVRLITFDQPGSTAFYEIDPRVNWHQVARTPPHTGIGFFSRLQLIGRIRAALRSIDRPIVVCFHHGILPRFLLAALGLRLRVVCSERNSLTLYQYIRRAKWSLGFMMLAFTHRITVQFPAYVRDYPLWLRARIRVIPNPVYAACARATPDLAGPDARFRLLTVGRLCAQKNQRLLIDAFAEVCTRHPLWDLHIVGEGEFKGELEAHIQQHGLGNRVILQGKRRDVPAWLAGAHIFCLPSQWEGFPNALAEAMAHGLPCVGLTSCAGVRDLIVDGVNGRLAERPALAQALDALMAAPQDRKRMGQASIERVAPYRPEETFRRWDDVLSQLDGPQ